jgi:glycosyltransferase 2 family protein
VAAGAVQRTAGRVAGAAQRTLGSRWTVPLVLLLSLAVATVSLTQVPRADPRPALVGIAVFAFGKYVLCPLRWHALSASGRNRRWHLRVYAESELLGILSPAHAGADLWRIRQLTHGASLGRSAAVADVALDRLVGAVGLTLFAALGGAALPREVLVLAVGGALTVLLAALAVRSRLTGVLGGRPLPPPRRLLHGVLLSMAYQGCVIGLIFAMVVAVGAAVSPLQLLAVFGASQIAGVVPGVHGAGPREGALVAGLVALGLPLAAAVGAISLSTVSRWLPALLLGGTALLLRRLSLRAAPVPA